MEVLKRLQNICGHFWQCSEVFWKLLEIFSRNPSHGKVKISCIWLRNSWQVHTVCILAGAHQSGYPTPRGGTRDFRWRGWSNGAKSEDPKKSLGLPAKTKKIPGPKINPQKIPCRFCGNSSDGKANWLNWSGWSLVHGRAPRDNADYCITRAM